MHAFTLSSAPDSSAAASDMRTVCRNAHTLRLGSPTTNSCLSSWYYQLASARTFARTSPTALLTAAMAADRNRYQRPPQPCGTPFPHPLSMNTALPSASATTTMRRSDLAARPLSSQSTPACSRVGIPDCASAAGAAPELPVYLATTYKTPSASATALRSPRSRPVNDSLVPAGKRSPRPPFVTRFDWRPHC